MSPTTATAAAGDWVEVHGPGGGPPRRGQILEVLGGPHRERYRVRWTDEHESILYPADGTHFLHAERRPRRRRASARRQRALTPTQAVANPETGDAAWRESGA